MSNITKTTEWENEHVRLVKLGGLAISGNFPKGAATNSSFRKIQGRKVSEIFVHHSAGPAKTGTAAAEGISSWCVLPPRYAVDANGQYIRKSNGKLKKIGGGRGWPGGPYTFIVPAIPDTVDGKLEIHRIWDDEWHTWHTGSGHNTRGVGICVAGWYESRHAKSSSARAAPDPLAMRALEALVVDYLFPRYSLTPKAVFGHFDAGKPTCPGDALEGWVRRLRGETWGEDADASSDDRPLDTAQQRQQALLDLGFSLDPYGADGKWGFVSRSALEAFQEDAEIKVDGVYGPQTEKAMRRALAALNQ